MAKMDLLLDPLLADFQDPDFDDLQGNRCLCRCQCWSLVGDYDICTPCADAQDAHHFPHDYIGAYDGLNKCKNFWRQQLTIIKKGRK